ncbi:hypothetical protein IFM89_026221 [Coptis chinensis]|uniref:R13L1/DRL21-like LRR repeat region domain-containing protein n=1 Tax=Coptis chinensis TaxID=261450 RepID=A0A835IBB2_9MAGN|nr:hypothetical protein IFM89_026221 [Coptis chinensis]
MAKKLRTFLTPTMPARTVPIELYRQLTCLRTLDLGGCEDIMELPNEVEGLLHLRYLNLWGTKVSELPETLCNLYNLQTLQLMRCTNLHKLPDGIGKLSNLRYLQIRETDALGYLPRGIGRLGFLRTLSKFIVGGGSKGCKMGELKHLNFLRGDLEIKGLEWVGGMNEAAEAELGKKKDLHGLTLQFGDTDAEKMEVVLKNLQPHKNLEKLAIKGYPSLHFPDWVTTASNIVTLKLSNCKNLRVLPDLSKLKSLETLVLRQLYEMEECEEMVPSNNEGKQEANIQLPRLREVVIQYCPKLKVVPYYIMFSPTLKEMSIDNCPELGGVQPRLPPLHGVFSKSVPLVGKSDESSYPNLKSVRIEYSPHSSLPKDFNQLTSIQSLFLDNCETLDFELEELKHLTMLQHLWIYNCPILKERFGEGKDWRSTLSHVPRITINYMEITRSRN